MLIKDIFQKPIDRDIKGVIKVGQDEEQNVRQELEEYVVTRELRKHFGTFFRAYKNGIVGKTDKMGVWISGFFGSGKSHFLKILSYLLGNKIVAGKVALEYFLDDEKINDGMVLADMKLAADTSADIILFNVDSKGESTGKQDKDAILSVFLKAFNEMQGFCGAYPFVADLERRLSAEGRLIEFQQVFAEINGFSWLEERYAVDFVQDDIVETLVQLDFMSEEAARNWCEKSTEPYVFSVERFAELVKKYIKSKGKNHHIIFLVDEIGQYIGSDSKLMLNLQTVTEDLGRVCQGKVWVVVTSQQEIDSITTNLSGNDFSKIQGRFDTRLSLSSANVDEVIRKRILAKNETALQTLTLYFDEKATTIKNAIIFKDGIEKKLYANRDDFAEVYPFVPYQFNLLGSVLTAIRTYGASGKHLADGERSMLALFKESADSIKDKELGALVPFNMFYEPLEEFIDHSHRGVISRALDNEYLNPNHEKDCFDVNVLKTLFMIKYVKEIKATVEQITSLMISHVDEDRLALQQKVEDALKRLSRQTLVQKNGDCYVFLTNEEQEINKAVLEQPVEPSEITAKASEMIFDGIYAEKRLRMPTMNGRYAYGFNQIVDERPYKANQNYPLTLKIITPNSDEFSDESTLRMISGQAHCVLVALPNDRAFIDEIRAALQIEKFIRVDTVQSITRYEELKETKKTEMREHNAQARMFLEEALKSAKIYVNGSKIVSGYKDVTSRINDALGKLAANIFHKNTYIDTATGENDIRVLFQRNAPQLTLSGTATPANNLALRDVSDYIAMNTARHMKISLKSIMERFLAPPYGFIEADVQWLVAKLFVDGEIALYTNNEIVTPLTQNTEELITYLTRNKYLEKIMLEKRVKANEKQKKAVRRVTQELFHISSLADDDDAIMRGFMNYADSLKQDLDKLLFRYYDNQPLYPGKQVVLAGRKLLNDVQQLKYTNEFFATLDEKLDDFLDFADDYEPVRNFFAGEQREIFDKAIRLMNIYDESQTFIVDAEIEKYAAEVKAIMQKPEPYSDIFKLPALLDSYVSTYSKLLMELQQPVLTVIQEARKRVFDEVIKRNVPENLTDSFAERFKDIKEKAKHCNNVAVLQNIKLEADALKLRCLNEINKWAAEIEDKEKAKIDQNPSGQNASAEVVKKNPKPKAMKTVSIKSVNPETTWQLENAEDVRRYIVELEKKLLATLQEDTIINIEF